MRDIRRPDWAEPTVDRLTTARNTDSGSPVFPTIMDLLIFAAAVGLKKEKRLAVPAAGKAVPYRIFENNQKEGFIYLVALADKRDATVLAEEASDDAARIFEEYAAGGLEEIAGWLASNALDSSGVSALIAAIQGEVGLEEKKVANLSPI